MRVLIEAEEAKKILSKVKIQYDIVEVNLLDAIGRVSAEDIYSPINVPPFRRSLRDGFAVISDDVANASEMNPVRLEISGKIDAGEFKGIRVESGEAVEVATGAVMPDGADAVVMVENARVEGNSVYIKKGVAPKENVMLEGSDIQEGEVLVRKGEMIDEVLAGVIAGAGIGRIKVKEMRIGIISTGNELLNPGEEMKPGKIYDVNSYTIYGELKKLGAKPVLFGIVRDDREELEGKLLEALEKSHAVITSGSTSAGKGDLLYRIVEDLGEMVFHGVRVKPGKPFFFAKIDEKPVFGLPGFPTSCLTIFREFVADVVAKNLGFERYIKKSKGFLAKRIYSEGRRELLPVLVAGNRIFPVEKGSGAITSLSEANGYLEIAEGEEIIERGAEREVKLFRDPYDFIFGGLDLIDFIEAGGMVKRVYMKPEIAMVEFARGNFDAVIVKGEEFRIPYGFAGREGRTGAVNGYGIEADFKAKNHSQLINLLKSGKLDGVYLLKPFADKAGIEIEVEGDTGVALKARDELVQNLKSQISLLIK